VSWQLDAAKAPFQLSRSVFGDDTGHFAAALLNLGAQKRKIFTMTVDSNLSKG
jgi:hypothetical protein